MFKKVKKKFKSTQCRPIRYSLNWILKVSRSLDNWSQSQGIDLKPSRHLYGVFFEMRFFSKREKITIGARNIKMRRSTFRHFMRSYLVHILLFSAVRAVKHCLLYRSAYVMSNSMQILYSTPNNTHRHNALRSTFWLLFIRTQKFL